MTERLTSDEASRLLQQIVDIRHAGRVERCHALPHHGSYTDAAHQWGVAMLILKLWPEDFARLGPVALCHDIPEGWVGDIPAPVLRYGGTEVRATIARIERNISKELGVPSEHDLTEEDFTKLKVADRLEFILWAYEQVRMGNEGLQGSIDEALRYINAAPVPAPAGQLIAQILEHGINKARTKGMVERAAA